MRGQISRLSLFFPHSSMARAALAVCGLVLFLTAAPLHARAAVISDQRITEAADLALLNDPGVPAHRIDVRSLGGVVTLEGSVPNILARDRAPKVVETLKGVRSVVNRIEVEPPFLLPDQKIEEQVLSRLRENPATESFRLEAAVQDGRVTLTGKASSWQEKQLASTVTKQVRGVIAVVNDIQVSHPVQRTDQEIAADVASRLKWDVWVDDSGIDVRVDDGVVTLSGVAGSAAEKARARADGWVLGVRGVTDGELAVDWETSMDMRRERTDLLKHDRHIQQAIADAFILDPRLSPFDLEIRVRNGVAFLSGVVDSFQARRIAAQNARNTAGVLRVRNRIKVRPADPSPSDATIADDVRRALQDSPFTEAHQVDVQVTGGVVRLQGTVDTRFEKEIAEDLAAQVRGVVDVRNSLDILSRMLLDPDRDIEENIRDQLWWSPFVDQDLVEVEVEQGVATLRGTVDTWREYLAAEENAREGGAMRVVNRLRVKQSDTHEP